MGIFEELIEIWLNEVCDNNSLLTGLLQVIAKPVQHEPLSTTVYFFFSWNITINRRLSIISKRGE